MKLFYSGRGAGQVKEFSLHDLDDSQICRVIIDFSAEPLNNPKAIDNYGARLKITLDRAPDIDRNRSIKNKLDAISKITGALANNMSWDKPLDSDLAETFGSSKFISIT
ncbi:hypothetical protein HNE05_01315 [Aquipseudomonas campi]|uniref:Uncharacterized protein n=1 Tax=Aquipseudomonas campi TaxID=2731681 RepID=A0A6M8F7C2_9GAMM|nr:hypothetical protein [Pseudomonas campi]QKE62063.1 hypothetical protein HNE05_01315 [Pseudomonas campi]